MNKSVLHVVCDYIDEESCTLQKIKVNSDWIDIHTPSKDMVLIGCSSKCVKKVGTQGSMIQQEFTGKSGAQEFMIQWEFTDRMTHGKLPWTEKFHKKISEVIQMYVGSLQVIEDNMLYMVIERITCAFWANVFWTGMNLQQF